MIVSGIDLDDPRVKTAVAIVRGGLKASNELGQTELYRRLLQHAQALGVKDRFVDCAIEDFVATCADLLLWFCICQAREELPETDPPDFDALLQTALVAAGYYLGRPEMMPVVEAVP